MLINELKCIEVLMRYLINGESLETEISSKFDKMKDFENHKNNLFNLISINNLIKHFAGNQAFSLDTFLNTGIIPGMYTEPTAIPSTDPEYYTNYQEFYSNLIEALKENNYLFDEDNNIFVSSTNLEATIPQIWLYRLSQAVKREKYNKLFMYNKKSTSIKNKAELQDYLRTTKTFLVELSSSNPNVNLDEIYADREANVKNSAKSNKVNKVDDMIDLFKSSIPESCTAKVNKYRINESYWIIKKAEELGDAFYTAPLKFQEALISEWVTERIKCNSKASEETQKFILLASPTNNKYPIETLNKNDIISGLFSLYVKLLSTIEHDLSSVSLSDFKIKSYIDEKSQTSKIDRRAIDREISLLNIKIDELVQEALTIFEDIKKMDLLTEFDAISVKRIRYNSLTDIINRYKAEKESLEESKSKLNDIASLAFDNNRIMDLLALTSDNGQIHVEESTLTAELYNSQLSDPVFKVIINIRKLLNFIEDLNLTLEEYSYSKR